MHIEIVGANYQENTWIVGSSRSKSYLFEKGFKAVIIWVRNCESTKIYVAVWRYFSCRNVSDLAEIQLNSIHR